LPEIDVLGLRFLEESLENITQSREALLN
jgi:hypothetical protein